MYNQKLIIAAVVIAFAGMMDACSDDASKKSKTPPADCTLPGMVSCDGTCIDPLTDNNFCGADDACQNFTACVDGQMCVGGACSIKPADGKCPDGQVKCGEVCIDPKTNKSYCGADASCANYSDCAAQGKTCENGACVGGTVNECEPGKVKCGTDCIDPNTSDAFCGADASCQHYTACVDGKTCVGGACSSKPEDGKCSDGLVKCGEACIDPDSNNAYCGADDSCEHYVDCAKDGKTCENGACVGSGPANDCDPGKVKCGEDCIDPMTDNDHCGADAQCENFTACVDDKTCVGGECSSKPEDGKCNDGLVKCGEACIDPQTNKSFCGADDACANYTDCAAQGKTCEAGACVGGAPVNECDPGQVKCGEDCIDPRYNDKYCGADENCQNYIECKEHEWCMNGQCGAKPDQPDCEPGQSCQIYQACEPGTSTCTEDDKGFVYLDSCADSGKVIVRNLCETDDPNARMVCSTEGDGCIKQCKDGYEDVDGKCTHFVCEANEIRCDGNRVMVCNDARTGFDEQETCTATKPNTVVTCVGGQCVTECDEHSVDVDGVCTPLVCEPFNGTKCDGANIMRCNDMGTAYDHIEYCTTPVENADPGCNNGACTTVCKDGYIWEEGSCQKVDCTPGEKRCDGARVVVCNDSGTGYSTLENCETDEPNRWGSCENSACVTDCVNGYINVDGVCSLVICEANTIDCKGDKVVKCNSTGTAYETQETCTTSDEHASPICKNGACSSVCNTNYIEVSGVCTLVACNANEIRCDGDRIVECNSAGTGFNLKTDCSSLDPNAISTCTEVGGGGAKCDKTCKDGYAINNMDGGKCKKIVCNAGEYSCSTNSIIKCNSSGTGYEYASEVKCETTDPNAIAVCDSTKLQCVTMCKDGYIDVDGVCKKIICSAGEEYCMSEINAAKCNATGTDNEYVMTCEYGCEDGKCSEPIICTPGNYRCSSDNKAREVCSSKGTAWNVAETCTTTDPNATAFCNMVTLLCDTSCKDGYIGVGGVCNKIICIAGEEYCMGEYNAAKCNATGTDNEYVITCEYGCKDGVCTLPVICTSGDKKCDGDKVMVCNSAGTAYEVEENCTTTDPHATSICNAVTLTCDRACNDGYTLDDTMLCQEIICTPGYYKCDTNRLMKCNGFGTSFVEEMKCTTTDPHATAVCDAANAQCLINCNEGYTEEGGVCTPEQICTPNEAVCADDNTAAICSADGKSYESLLPCQTGQKCEDGVCKCQTAGLVNCGECIDPNTSDNYCGADNTCSSYSVCLEHSSCQSGSCVCDTNYVQCGSECIDPKTSNAYCGADNTCGNYTTCNPDQTCVNGQCKCDSNLVACGAECIDPKTNDTYCGADNTCANYTTCNSDQTCQNGACVCNETGKVMCSGVCIDPMTSNLYCGADDACENYSRCGGLVGIHDNLERQICIDGECKCPEDTPHYCEVGSGLGFCVDLQTDPGHCGHPLCKNSCYSVQNMMAGGLSLEMIQQCRESLENCPVEIGCEAGMCVYNNGCMIFVDSAIEAYALAHWDTDNDGCIKGNEARAVTEIPSGAFKNNTSVQTLADLNKFTNLTTIGKFAFERATNLRTVDLTRVTTVGEGAFVYSGVETMKIKKLGEVPSSLCSTCDNLTSIDFPNATKIQDNAFANCSKLSSINLPKVEMINNYAFKNAISTGTVLELPAVTTIYYNVFENAKLKSIALTADNPRTIWDNAFYKSSVKTVTGNNLYSIGDYAFSDTDLETIVLDNVVSIGNKAFRNSPLSNFTSNGLGELNKLTSIGDSAFANTAIVELTMKNIKTLGNGIVDTNVMDYLYIDWNYPYNVTISCEKLGSTNWTRIKRFDSPQTLLGTSSCNDSSPLEIEDYYHYSVRFSNESGKGLKYVGSITSSATWISNPLKDWTGLTKVRFDIVEVVPAQAFYGLSKLREASIDSAKEVKEKAFMGAGVEKMIMPNVHTIGEQAFANTTSLQYVYMPSLTKMDSTAFSGSASGKSVDRSECVDAQQNGCVTGRFCYTPVTTYGKKYMFYWPCPYNGNNNWCKIHDHGIMECRTNP